MKEWKKVKLGELCHFINGGAWSDKEYVPEGVPVLKVTNCKKTGFDLSDINYLPLSSQKKYSHNELHLHDVIIATVGSHPNLVNSSAGRSVIVNSLVSGFYLNQNAVCVRTKDKNTLNQLYFGYYSKYYLFQNYIQMRGKGAANQMRIAISSIKDYPMPLPPIEHQMYIADILSRYDSLIENYQKQIKLLEESAQRLYKEWFIDLRFPGHENTKIVDGVPEGWEKKKINEIALLKAGGDKPEIVSENRTKICNIPIYSNGTSNEGLYGYTDKPEITEHCITISARGSVGYTVMRRKPFVPIVRLISVIPQSIYVGYLYFYTKQIPLDSNGAAQQQITIPMIRDKEIIIPTNFILDELERCLEPMFKHIDDLKSLIRHLTEARDRLLPKLMSEEIKIN